LPFDYNASFSTIPVYPIGGGYGIISLITIPGGAISKNNGNVKVLVEPILEDILTTTSSNTWGTRTYDPFIASAVFNISVEGYSGEFTLQADVTFGFLIYPLGYNISDLCLGYILESNYEWKCQETATLTWINSSYVVTKTPHFTGFGMILNPNNNPQLSTQNFGLPIWEFVVIIVPPVLAVILVIVISYYRFRHKMKKNTTIHLKKVLSMSDVQLMPMESA